MKDPLACPECGESIDTERVYQDKRAGGFMEVYICNSCPTEWENHYALSHKEVTRSEA